MTASRYAIWLLGAFASLTPVLPAGAQTQIYSREQDIPEVRLGQHIQIDDGSCPTGQIKEVSGTTLTAAGVTRVRKCVPRLGTKKK
ncbi:MAG: hypothetical protein JWP84_896 [Tardiphaga sp.]|nr:hypothetical protein [Tardiphaga sp.]